MATQIGLNSKTLKTVRDEELRRLLRSAGGRDLEKVRAELKRRMLQIKQELQQMKHRHTKVIYSQVVTRWDDNVFEIGGIDGRSLYDLSGCWAQIVIRTVLDEST